MSVDKLKRDVIDAAQKYKSRYKQLLNIDDLDTFKRLMSVYSHLDGIGGGGNLQQVTDEGNTTTNTIETAGTKSDYFLLDTTATPTLQQGMLFWDEDRSTVGLQMNGVDAHLGQDNFWYVKNQTGSPIPKGTAVMAVGALGASSRILVAPMIADGSVEAKYFLGITAEEILNGEDGFVTNIGKIRGIDTSVYGAQAGQILYCDPANPGGFTITQPQAPNLNIPAAFTVDYKSNGTIAVRALPGYHLSELHDVYINTPSDQDILLYNGTNNRWENTPLASAVPTPTLQTVTDAGNITTKYTVVGSLGLGASQHPTLQNSNGSLRFNINSTNYSYKWYRGSELMRLVGNGNLLIGTTTDAGYKLDVNGSIRGTTSLNLTGSGRTFSIENYSSTPAGVRYIASANDHIFYIGSTESARIGVNGVKTGSTITSSAQVSSYKANAGLTGYAGWFKTPAAATGGVAYGIYSEASSNQTNIAGWFKASGGNTANYGLIVEDGNVGIGTSTPPYKFTISDSIVGVGGAFPPSVYISLSRSSSGGSPLATYFTDERYTLSGTDSFGNSLGKQLFATINSTGTNTVFRNVMSRVHTITAGAANAIAHYATHAELNGSGTISNWFGMVLGGNVTGFPSLSSFQGTSTITNTYGLFLGSFTAGTQTNAPYAIFQAGTENIHLKGNVLINTTTDAGYKLDVNGNVKVSGTIEAVGGTSSDWNTAYSWGDHSTQGYITGTTGFTGTFTVPTNPPGQQNLDIQNGLIVNVF